jgi:hypothetical protein
LQRFKVKVWLVTVVKVKEPVKLRRGRLISEPTVAAGLIVRKELHGHDQALAHSQA